MSAYGASFSLFSDLDAVLLESYRMVVPDIVCQELSRLCLEGGRVGSAARLALRLCKNLQIIHVDAKDGDEAILQLADLYRGKVVVCTNDIELKNILKAQGVRVIGVRDYSHLDFL